MIETTVFTDASSVERLLRAGMVAVSPASMMGWLAGPMTEGIQQRANERFLAQGDETTGPWEPLRDTTLMFRDAQGFGPAPINVRTGELERYITDSPGGVISTGQGATLVYPGDAPDNKYLTRKVVTAQQGWPGGANKASTPARPVLALGMPDMEYALVSLAGWIQTSITTGRI